jgi:hypothetical protein
MDDILCLGVTASFSIYFMHSMKYKSSRPLVNEEIFFKKLY